MHRQRNCIVCVTMAILIAGIALVFWLSSNADAEMRFGAKGCLSLNGSGWAQHADDPALDLGYGDVYIGAWVKLEGDKSDERQIICKHVNPAFEGYALYVRKSGYLTFSAKDADANVITTTDDGTDIVDGIWHYVAVSFDKDGNITRFVDGVSNGTINAHSVTGDINPTTVFQIGIRSGTSDPFIGQIALAELLYFGYNGLPTGTGETAADYAAWRYWHPYAPFDQFAGGAWDGYDDALRTTILNEGDFATSTKWAQSSAGGTPVSFAGEKATYIGDGFYHSAYQNAANRISVGENSAYYELEYEVLANTLTGGTVNQRLQFPEGFPNATSYLAESVGVHQKVFLTKNDASTSNFDVALTGGATGGSIELDNISLTRVGRVVTYPMNRNLLDEDEAGVAGPNGLDLTAGGSGNKWLWSTIRAARFETPELVTNGGFEADVDGTSPPTGWTNLSSPTVNETDDALAHSGTKSNKITVDALTEGCQQTGIPVIAGKTYEIIAWAYGDGVKKWTIKGYGILHSNLSLTTNTAIPATWTIYSKVFTASYTENIIMQTYSGTDNTDGTLWWDDISLKRVDRVRFE